MLTSTTVPRATGNWSCGLSSRVCNSPRSLLRGCLDNALVPTRSPGCTSLRVLSLPKTLCLAPRQLLLLSDLQPVSCFFSWRRASWSVGKPQQASPCTDRPVSETRGAISLFWLPFCGLRTHSSWLDVTRWSWSLPLHRNISCELMVRNLSFTVEDQPPS